MLSFLQNLVILFFVMCGTMLFMVVLNRMWPRFKRREHNDIIGWQASILGTIYAVILGFMLYTVWTTFCGADLNAELEANALRNVYRLAAGLPTEQRAKIEGLCLAYADAVVNKDWPAMAHGNLPEGSHLVNQEMWKTILSVKVADPPQIVAEDHLITELSSMTQYRRTRLIQSAYHLPAVFWAVLIVGGLLTISSGAMFGAGSAGLHSVQILSLTLLITLILLAIADVNLPFRGWVHVSSFAFERASEFMTQ